MDAKQGGVIPPLPQQPSGGAADPSRSDDGDLDDPDLGSVGQMRSRKRTKHGRYISDISLEEVQQYFHLPAHVACERLGLGLTSFKRVCRTLGIQTWPYRKGPGGVVHTVQCPPEGSEEWRSRAGVAAPERVLPHNGGSAFVGLSAAPSTSAYPTAAAAAFVAAINDLAALQPPTSAAPPPQPSLSPQFMASLFSGTAPGAPPVPTVEDSMLHRLFRQTTPATFVVLLDKARAFSAEMKTTLGVTIIDDSAVDLLHYVSSRVRDAMAAVHAPQAVRGAVAPPPPLSPAPSTSVPSPWAEATASAADGGPPHPGAMSILSALAAAYAGGQGAASGGAGGSGQSHPMGPR